MKIFNLSTLALAATCCVSFAQQPAENTKLRASVLLPNAKKMVVIPLDGANPEGKFLYTANGQAMAMDPKSCKVFIIHTPPELADGLRLQSSHEYKAARQKLAACKQKYISYVALPNNPSTRAALAEIQCAVSMLDFPALGDMVKKFPAGGLTKEKPKKEGEGKTSFKEKNAYSFVVAANLMSQIKDGMTAKEGEALQKAVAGRIAELNPPEGKASASPRDTGGRVYGWLKYTSGRALAAQIPQDAIKNRSISEGQRELASAAIDAYCEAVVAPHGADMELAVDAMIRSQEILWAMPNVKAYQDSHPGSMSAATWKGAPQDFKDAVVHAYMIRHVFGVSAERKIPAVDEAIRFYFNEQEGKGDSDAKK